jgi:Acyl-CoA reductase (LuxC)
MSKRLHYFASGMRRWAVALPFDLDELTSEWSQLRSVMVRSVPDAFSRDEWAYLITFLDPNNLAKPFEEAFGRRLADVTGSVDLLARPRGPVAVWLPNNVSLLGPLLLVLLSLTGNPVRLKAGSQTQDLTGALLDFARARLPSGSLAKYLDECVQLETFDRDDPRGRDMAKGAAARVMFGSDEGIAAVDAFEHSPGSIAIPFSDRRSEAWLETSRLDQETLNTLIKVFAIYGRAGCTSPSRVVLVNGRLEEAVTLRDRLLELWPDAARNDVPIHVASENMLARQWAAALGWNAELAPRNRAMVAVGSPDLPPVGGFMALQLVPATVERAVETLPPNIQTIGHALERPDDPRWLQILASTSVKRFVPLARMHHFGPLWDGYDYWRQLFEIVEVA